MSATSDEFDYERELAGLWLSRVMFNMFTFLAPETRTFEEFLQAHPFVAGEAG